jgi:hypothetical protein
LAQKHYPALMGSMVAVNVSIYLPSSHDGGVLARKVAPQDQTSADLLRGYQQYSCIQGYMLCISWAALLEKAVLSLFSPRLVAFRA